MTLGFASPILGILRGEAHFSLISASFYAQSVEMNRYLLPKRIAGNLSHRLGARSLHYWGMSRTLEIACRREVCRQRWSEEGAWNRQC
jgi:hypothetical protein